jgi:hypothetical protein
MRFTLNRVQLMRAGLRLWSTTALGDLAIQCRACLSVWSPARIHGFAVADGWEQCPLGCPAHRSPEELREYRLSRFGAEQTAKLEARE